MANGYSNIANTKVQRRWCDDCGTLLLGKKCSVCSATGREFEINSPGDIRPCMGDSVKLVEELFENAFGTSLPIKSKCIFLNKIPGEDRADEIIAHGRVIGVLNFDLSKNDFALTLRQGGAEIFAKDAKKNIVTIQGISGHLKGKGVPGENIVQCVGVFDKGSPLIIIKGQKIGAGTASVSSAHINDEEKTVRVKSLELQSGLPLSPDADMKTFVSCNKSYLKELEKRGVEEIKTQIKDSKVPLTVAFSGGKDSLAAFGIQYKQHPDLELLFTDTRLEFPDTLEYVKKFAEKRKLKLHVAKQDNGFEKNVDVFGPPAKDFRWCCKICKLGPITNLISEDFSKGVLTAEGNRSLESFSRADTPFKTKNPFIPNQTNLNPIRNWTAQEVWGYIWMEKFEYNPLYERDYERLGCYLCPQCLSSEWRNTGKIYPKMYRKWEDYLRAYAEEKELPPEYVDMGFWRWKSLPPKMKQLASELDLKIHPKEDKLSMKTLKGASVCAAGGYSAEAIMTVPRKIPFGELQEIFNTVGKTTVSEDYEIALVRLPGSTAKVFGGGQISVTAETQEETEKLFSKIVKAYIRSEMCTSCRICERTCTKKAIKIKNGIRIDQSKCNACGKCEKSCMVVHYYDKIVSGGSVGKSDSQKRFKNNSRHRTVRQKR